MAICNAILRMPLNLPTRKLIDLSDCDQLNNAAAPPDTEDGNLGVLAYMAKETSQVQ